MPKTMDVAVRDILGQQLMTIAAQQVQIEELTEQLAEAKKASDPKHNVARTIDTPLHEVKR